MNLRPNVTIKDLSLMSLLPFKRRILRWYWARIEYSANISANIERRKVNQALNDARHFETKAIIARSNKNQF